MESGRSKTITNAVWRLPDSDTGAEGRCVASWRRWRTKLWRRVLAAHGVDHSSTGTKISSGYPSRQSRPSKSSLINPAGQAYPSPMVAIEIGGGVEEARIPREARGVLHRLAAAWADVADCRALEVAPIKGALTNAVYQIKWPTIGGDCGDKRAHRKVLVRVYGEGVEVFFDREDEIRTFECMSRHGQGPRLLGRFPNGRVEEFIHARTLSAVDLRDPEISALIASKLREFHDLDMPGPRNILLWDRLRNWLKAAKNMCVAEEAKELCLDALEEEIASLEFELSGEDQKIGFCHNDLQYGNIMIDDETRLVTLIDYEYASFNPIAYDLANHFCEMAADYHSEKPHIMDYSKYPGEKPSEQEVEHLLDGIEKYALASHLVWGLWGMISDHVNDIDFNYMEYARQRFQQYWLRKPMTLGSKTNCPVMRGSDFSSTH